MRRGLCVLFFLAFASPARAADFAVSAGVNVSGAQILATQKYAPSAHVALDVLGVHGFTLGARDELMILFPRGGGDKKYGFHNRTSVSVGWAWTDFTASLGFGLSQYAMSACSAKLCSYTSGVAPTADVALAYFSPSFLSGALGVRLAGSIGWYSGDSAVLSNTWIGMLSIGPLLRFGARK